MEIWVFWSETRSQEKIRSGSRLPGGIPGGAANEQNEPEVPSQEPVETAQLELQDGTQTDQNRKQHPEPEDEGASSQVWDGDWAGARVVIKVLREHEALRSFLSEVNIWKQLRHPCVCALLGVCTFDGRPSMVLEFMTGGSLHDLLHNPKSQQHDVDHILAARLVNEVASGLAYLHANGVMHRDIKTANVLLDEARHAKVR